MTARKGFTLVEILVSVSVIGLLLGLGLAQYSRFNRRQIVEQAARNLIQSLRLAQNKALSGEKDCSSGVCGGNDDVCGNDATDPNDNELTRWCVSFNANGYQIFGDCEGNYFRTKNYNLPEKVTFQPIPGDLCFLPVGQGVTFAGPGSSLAINLSGYDLTKTVTVYQSGEIK
jgi:prepilin-type N-terminal cleavage/methylation domain-containing protein